MSFSSAARRLAKRSIRAAVAIFLILAAARTASAASTTLAWDPNTESDLAGYKLSYGTVPGSYTTVVDVGTATQWTVWGLAADVTYYFVVQAYNTQNLVSRPSNSVAYTVPIVAQTGRLTYDPNTGAWSKPLYDDNGNTPAAAPGWVVTRADFNGDGATDYLLYNPVTGAWLKAIDNREGTYSFFGYLWAPGWTPYVLDMDGDGRSDVFLYNRSTGRWFRCMTIGPADFAYTPGVWATGWRIIPADFNGDGATDLFLYNDNPAPNPNSGLWFRVLSSASGFAYLQGDIRWASDWQVTAADFDGDGRSDLFLYRANGQWFRVMFNRPWGGTQYIGGAWAPGWNITPGDFDGDGKTDLFLYNPVSGRWFMTRTMGDSWGFYPGTWGPGWTILPADFNKDGRTDLALYNTINGIWFEATTVGPGVFGWTTGTGPASATLSIVR